MRIRRTALGCLLAASLWCAWAQVASSRLEGVVQDESGAVVPKATATVVNERTGATVQTATSGEGLYVFPSLLPGRYTVTVEAAGFRKAVHTEVELNVAATVVEHFRLEVGQVTESVAVEASAERVQSSESQISRAVTLRDIEVLPQLGRTPIILAAFQPGVQINPGDVTFSRVNGTRQGSNNSKLDGIDVNDAVVPRLGLSLTANNTDSVEEFRVVTNGGKAEYGRSAGAQVELITKSGTNNFHGGGFDYLRNTVLHANNFFNNSSRVPRPKFIQNTLGGSLGGPVRKDRTFVFGNYQARRTRQEIVRNRTVLTPTAKSGVFRWTPPGSSTVQSFDILRNDPRGRGLDRLVAEELKLLPDPNNTDVGDGLNTAGFRFNNPNNSYEDQFTIRADHNLTSAQRLFYRHSWQRNNFIDSLNNADARYPGQPHGTQGGHRWGLSAGWDWSVTPRTVNEFRFGYQSASVAFRRPARLPGPMLIANSWTDPRNTAFAQGRNSPVKEFTENITAVRGSHTFKAGANIRYTKQWGYNDAGIYPNVSFARASGNIPPATIGPSGSTTISSADRQRFEELYNDLLGRMSQVTQTFYSDLEKFQAAGMPRVRNYLFHEYGYFFQDDWKIRRNLTLNLGLRYEFNGVPFERDNLQGTLDKSAQVNPSSRLNDLTIVRSDKWYNNDYNNFAPRIGFAWDPTSDGKTSLRGGYGIYYDRFIGATTSYVDGNTPGFSQVQTVFPNSAAGSDVRAGDAVPLPQQPPAPQLRLPNNRQNTIGLFAPDLRTGYYQHISLTIQRELFRNTVIEAGYVGTRGVKLFTDLNVNQRRIEGDFLQAFQEIQAFRARGAAVPASNTLVRIFGSPAAAVTAIGASVFDQGLAGTAADTLDRNNYTRYSAAGISDYYIRNFPQYNLAVVGGNHGRSYYNSLQLSLRRQQGALKFYANYTFSKTIDNISVDGNGFTAPIDNFNLRLNRAIADPDRPHVFNSSFIYTLPIGQGKRFGTNLPAWADSLIGGWDLGVLNIWESGATMTMSSGRQTVGSTATTWANYSGDRHIGRVDRRGNGVFWLNADEISRFSFAGAGQIGTSGRNAFRGPRYFNIDLSLVKSFRIHESHRVALRWEFYNLFNNPNFANPGNSLVTPASFGRISAMTGGPRIMQVALRYDF
jgi:hypothetical protein